MSEKSLLKGPIGIRKLDGTLGSEGQGPVAVTAATWSTTEAVLPPGGEWPSDTATIRTV